MAKANGVNDKKELNEKQKKFCEEYLIDFNGTRAAIAAGYSEKTARSTASENLTKPNIQEYLQELINQRSERTKITQDEVVKKIREVVEVCTQKIEQTLENGDIIDRMIDVNGANKALDMLMKHTGGYKEDNQQQQSIINNTISGFDSMEEAVKHFKEMIGE